MIYFDNAATSFPKPQIVYDEIMAAMTQYGANPGRSGHKLALRSSRGIFKTRNKLSRLFNIKNPMNLILTFNCTESLNLGIKGFLKAGDHVITTSMEHNSVLRPIMALEKLGTTNTIAIIDIEAIGKIAKSHDIVYLVDGAQSAGVYPIDVEKMNIDMLAFPGHKSLLGPQGTGGLYIREGLDLDMVEIFQGGTGSASNLLEQPDMMPDKFESGTLNVAGSV